jgi:nucleoside 2-deoxyribosyltransferase
MSQKAFIAMPFSKSYDELINIIKRSAMRSNIDVVKIDELSFTGSIIDKIRSELYQSDLLIAIVSEENGNVYYEIGLAHCQNIPVILLTNDINKLKFDLRDHRAIIYDENNTDEIFNNLSKMIQSTLNTKFEYPHDYFASVYGRDPEKATELGHKKIIKTIKDIFDLTDPQIVDWRVLPEGELAVTVKDYMGMEIRAVFDKNGLLKKSSTI